MIIRYEAGLPETENVGFLLALADALAPIAERPPDFVPVPQTVGQIEIVIELAEGESTKSDILDAVMPVMNSFVPLSIDAKCRIQNCGSIPISTWHRWSI